jgi:thiazole tautomerase (transcriptional regulator TenI)
LKRPALVMVTTGTQPLEQVAEILSRCPSELVDALHIREKHRTARELLEWAALCSKRFPRAPLYINDRVDVALAAKAHGVQLAYHSLPAEAVRAIAGRQLRVGCSVHSVEEAAAAQASGADYVIYGHVYGTSSKPSLAPRGVAALRAVVEAVSVPVIAIGGMDPSRAAEVLSSGCAGIAVMSGIWMHSDPAGQIRKLRAALDGSPHKPKLYLQP